MTRQPRGIWGWVESSEDCSHASQLGQQRLQLQPLSSPWQTGRVAFSSLLPSDSPGRGLKKRVRPPCPALGTEERGSGLWHEHSVRRKTWYLQSS